MAGKKNSGAKSKATTCKKVEMPYGMRVICFKNGKIVSNKPFRKGR